MDVNCISLNKCTSQLLMPSDNICTKLKSRLEYFVRFENMRYEFKKLDSVFCIADLFFKYYFIYSLYF